jgi:hypothetical protein
MCGKELQINYAQIVGMQGIVNTTTLGEKKVPINVASSVSLSSGMYYGVFVTSIYFFVPAEKRGKVYLF